MGSECEGGSDSEYEYVSDILRNLGAWKVRTTS